MAGRTGLHIDIELPLNHLAAADPALAQMAGYYYGLAHFLVTPLVLAWLWLRRPAAFGRLRSALVLSTTAANLVFWTWPAAPPRFAVPGMTDVLDRYHILGSGDPHGPDGLVNLYAAMPSLHVAWAAWCAAAVVIATRGRWRHLAWLYPAATTFVVLASANHFVLDVAAGLAVMTLGLLAARAHARQPAGAPRGRMPPGPGRAARYRRPHRPPWAPARHPATGDPLSGGGGWPGGGRGRSPGGTVALVALCVPAVCGVRATVADGLRLTWLGAAAAAEALCVAGLVMRSANCWLRPAPGCRPGPWPPPCSLPPAWPGCRPRDQPPRPHGRPGSTAPRARHRQALGQHQARHARF